MQVCTLLQTDKHASTPPLSFLQAGCPSCRPTNSVRALKAVDYRKTIIIYTATILVQQCNLAMSMPCDVMQSEREAE